MRPLLLLALAATLLVSGEPVVAPTQALPEGVFAVVIVPDVRATFGRIEQAAQVLAPGSLPAGQLASMLGSSIGDPELANLGAGPLLIAVGPGGAAPNVALIVPATDGAAYVAAAQRFRTQAEAVGQLVVVGNKPADVALGKRIAGEHAALAAAPIAGDVRVLLAPKRTITAYRPIIGGFTSMITAQFARQPNGAFMAPLIGLEIAGLLAAAAEVEACQVDIALEGAVIASRTTVQAGSDSGLAKAFVAPTTPPAAVTRAAARMGLDPGYVVMVGRYHAEGACAWLTDLLAGLRQQPEGKDLIDDSLLTLLGRYGANLDGACAMRMRAVGDKPMRMDMAMGIRDAAAQAAMQQELIERVLGAGWIRDVYRELGVESTFTAKARTVGDVAVDRLAYRLDPAKVPEVQAEQMQRFMQDSEFAIVPDAILMANAAEDLDRLIAGNGQPLPTTAEHAIGGGRDGYLDLDWMGMIKAIGQATPQADFMTAVFAKLTPGEPMTGAWTARDGRLLWESRLPLKPFFDYGRAMQEVMMERFQHHQGPGDDEEPDAPAPPENPEQVF